MDKNTIIERVYSDPFFVQYISGLVSEHKQEAHSEFIAILCELDEEKLKQLNQFHELRYYCIRIIYNMIANPNSQFNKVYREHLVDIDSIQYDKTTEDDLEEGTELLEDIRAFLKKRSKRVDGAWADEMLFNKYIMEGRTYRQIAAETGIHYVSLFKSMKLIKEMLKTKFLCQYSK